MFLIHFDPDSGAAEGLWCLDDTDRPESLYRDPWGHAAFWGSVTMANTDEHVCWYRFWDQLAARAPYGIWWENVVSDLEPEQLLAKLPALTSDAAGHDWGGCRPA